MKTSLLHISLLTFIIVSCQSNPVEQHTSKTTLPSDFMWKLYKNINEELHYWETWNNDAHTAIIHWGKVGQTGDQKEVQNGLSTGMRTIVQKEMDEMIKAGYAEIEDSQLAFLQIEYTIDGFGSTADLEKRHRLEDRLNETLGWTGLGHVDGGSIGSGTMEVSCMVVDFEMAKNIIIKDLQNTEFKDYSRIFELE